MKPQDIIRSVGQNIGDARAIFLNLEAKTSAEDTAKQNRFSMEAGKPRTH